MMFDAGIPHGVGDYLGQVKDGVPHGQVSGVGEERGRRRQTGPAGWSTRYTAGWGWSSFDADRQPDVL